jgi:hypothetical protein
MIVRVLALAMQIAQHVLVIPRCGVSSGSVIDCAGHKP